MPQTPQEEEIYLSPVKSPITAEPEFIEPLPDDSEIQESPGLDTSAFETTLLNEYGLTKEALVNGIRMVTEMSEQKNATDGYAQLQESWGTEPAEVKQRLELVQEYWGKLPKEQQAQLDNVPGAVYIWNQIERSRSAKNSTAPASSTGTVPQMSYDFTEAQLMSMSETDRARFDRQITAAYANGRVKGA